MSETDPSRLEAAEAGLHHEAAEADAGVPPRGHVTAEELLPDAFAQAANADVDVERDDTSHLIWYVVGTVAVAVLLAVIALVVVAAGS